jgi:hypothetical protein
VNETTSQLLALGVGAAIGIGSVVWFVVWLGGFIYDIVKTTSKRRRGRRARIID